MGGGGGGVSQKTLFRPFGPHFGLKIRGGGVGCGATPLDPPLMIQVRMQEFKFGGVQKCDGLKVIF